MALFLPLGGGCGHQTKPQPPSEHLLIPEKGQGSFFRKNWKIPLPGRQLNPLTSEEVSRPAATAVGNSTVPNACVISVFVFWS